MQRSVSAVRVRRKYLTQELPVPIGTVYLPFEIKLPASIKTVTGIAFTNTANNVGGQVTKLGTIGFLSNDETDLFLCLDVYDDVYAPTDEELALLSPLTPETNQPWVTGKGPGFTRVSVGGNTGTISGWFKTPGVTTAYTIKLYVQYEDLDELIELEETVS